MTVWASQVALYHFDSNPVVDSSVNQTPMFMNNSPGCSPANPKIGPMSLVCVPNANVGIKVVANAPEPKLLLGTNDFYVACWVWFNTVNVLYPSGGQFVYDMRGSVGGNGPYLRIHNDGAGHVEWEVGDGAVQGASVGFNVQPNTWYLTELRKVGTKGVLYINGQPVAYCDFTLDYNNSGGALMFGAAWYFPLAADSMDGFIDEFNLRVGVENIPLNGRVHSGLSNFSRLVSA